MGTTIRGITYECLCAKALRIGDEIDRKLSETRRTAYLLADAEEHWYSRISYYRDQLDTIKARTNQASIELQRHVAHCTEGCKRATHGASFAARVTDRGAYDRSPHRLKPELPGATSLAAMLQQGQTIDGLAAVYERSPDTIRTRLTYAGYSAVTGHPRRQKAAPCDGDKAPRPAFWQFPPWIADANCASTDPEAFFPEKGGSTRAAKGVCSRCPVAAECLDYALESGERFGIFGGLSERERRKVSSQREAS